MGLGQLIENERKRRGMTQAELGERLGVSQATIDRWERGQNPPVAKHWAGLARFLNLTKAEIGEMAGRRRTTNADLHRRIDQLQTEVNEIRRLVVRALGEQ